MELMSTLYRLMGRVWVPGPLRHREEPCLLHVTDTPSSCFGALEQLLRVLKPEVIVHTGDLVDDVKLALYPGALDRYRKGLGRLVRTMEASGAERIYLCLGNHDHLETVQALCTRTEAVEGAVRFQMEGRSVAAAHHYKEIAGDSPDYALFGHDLTCRTGIEAGVFRLNGLKAIHVVLPESGKVYFLPYPSGTDDHRLGRSKIGL